MLIEAQVVVVVDLLASLLEGVGDRGCAAEQVENLVEFQPLHTVEEPGDEFSLAALISGAGEHRCRLNYRGAHGCLLRRESYPRQAFF